LSRIGIRVDGDARIGLGHVFQQVQLAKYLRETQDAEIFFFTRESGRAEFISKKYTEFNWIFIPKSVNLFGSFKTLENISMKKVFDLIIFDITDPYPILKETEHFHSIIHDFKKRGIKTLGFEYIGTKNYNANAIVNPSVVDYWREYSKSDENIYFLGPKYVILELVYTELNRQNRVISDDLSRILLCMGGSDKNNVTGKVLKQLLDLDLGLKIDIILGPMHAILDDPKGPFVDSSDDVSIHNVSWNIWEHMMKCDLAIVSAGRLPYELAATGTPSISIPIVEHQEHTADAFQALGTTIKLPSSFSGEDLRETIDAMSDSGLRKRMSHQGKITVDGRGLERLSELIDLLTG